MNNKAILKGTDFRVGTIDVSTETVPATAAFKSFGADEKAVPEPRPVKMAFNRIFEAFRDEEISPFDKRILTLFAKFANLALTSRTIFELLTLSGVKTNRTHIDTSLKRLFRFMLIDSVKFETADGRVSNMKVYTMSKYGVDAMRSLGVSVRMNMFENATNDASQFKRKAAAANLIVNWLKNLSVYSISIRPLLTGKQDGAVVRPIAQIWLWNTKVFIEVPRTYDGWLDDFLDKLHRYDLVFADRPTIVINGENVEMNREISAAAAREKINAEIFYTDDLAMYGTSFKTGLYTFTPDGEVIRYMITDEGEDENTADPAEDISDTAESENDTDSAPYADTSESSVADSAACSDSADFPAAPQPDNITSEETADETPSDSDSSPAQSFEPTIPTAADEHSAPGISDQLALSPRSPLSEDTDNSHHTEHIQPSDDSYSAEYIQPAADSHKAENTQSAEDEPAEAAYTPAFPDIAQTNPAQTPCGASDSESTGENGANVIFNINNTFSLE